MITIAIDRKSFEENSALASYFTIARDLTELSFQIYDDAVDTLILTDAFIDREISWSKLEEFILPVHLIKPKLRVLIVGMDIKVNVENTTPIKVNWKSPEEINWIINNLYKFNSSAISNTFDKIYNDFMVNVQDPSSLAQYILKFPDESQDVLYRVFDYYNKGYKDKMAQESTINRLRIQNDGLSKQLQIEEERNKSMSFESERVKYLYVDLINKLNDQYSLPIHDAGSLGYVVDDTTYRKILYVKQVSHLRYLPSLIYYLTTMNNSLHQEKTRYMIIEPQGKPSAQLIHPNLSLTNTPTIGELNNDDLLMVGYQKDIMHSVLNNVMNYGWLIVLDRTGTDYLFLRGKCVETLYTMNDPKDNFAFRYPSSRIVSYSRDGLHIPHVANFEEMDAHVRLKTYSDMSITKQLLDILGRE